MQMEACIHHRGLAWRKFRPYMRSRPYGKRTKCIVPRPTANCTTTFYPAVVATTTLVMSTIAAVASSPKRRTECS
jgi:mRNA-degrading endonuclease toxin of MazEF toxin-antitoxin module